MDLSMDRIDWILLSLVLSFGLLIPMPYYVYTYAKNVHFVPYWTGINVVIQGLGAMALIAWAGYRMYKQSRRAAK